jgi:hypothetical protein
MGLTLEEWVQCLLRECIKQKKVWGKISEKIKED